MPARSIPAADTVADLLRARAELSPEDTAFTLLDDGGGDEVLSYAELDHRARAVAALLAGVDTPVLLLHPPGARYLASFFGCLYAGVVAVPVYPPASERGLARVLGVAKDAGAALALTDRLTAGAVRARFGPAAFGELRWLATDETPADAADGWTPRSGPPPQVAFLQYTSGSTGAPKGVVVGHDNLLTNAETVARALRLGPDDVAVSWLPPYHDMGLIGGILQPVHGGFPAVLLSPLAFVREPVRWLAAMSRFRGTVSPAPDFAYAECARRISEQERAGLDLSSWRLALVGAEPVRARTLAAFAAAMGPVGFRRSSFYPCYGLAEATLLVTGERLDGGASEVGVSRAALARGRLRPGTDATLVGAGRPQGVDVLVVDPEAVVPCPPGAVGEVWVSGPTVARGYWRRPEETARTFGARLAGDDRRFLRTGDLAAWDGSQLVLVGRSKDLIVVRGRNHHAQDLEHTAERAHPALRPGRCAAFAVDDGDRERVVIVAEPDESAGEVDEQSVATAVQEAVAASHGLRLDDVVLARPGTVPRTSSGKVRRQACRDRYLSGTFGHRTPPLASPRADAGTPAAVAEVAGAAGPGPVAGEPAAPGGGRGVAEVVGAVLGVEPSTLPTEVPLLGLGLDSLRVGQLRAELARRQGVEVPLDRLLDGATLADLDRMVGTAPPSTPVPRRPDDEPVPAAPGQQRLWLLDQVGAGRAYQLAAAVRLLGPVDAVALGRAVARLAERHEALRTRLRLSPEGTLLLGFDAVPEPPAVRDAPELAGMVGDACRATLADRWRRELGHPMDLRREAPLRSLLLRVSADEHVLLVAVHHLAVDGVSAGVLLRELDTLYAAALTGRPGPLPAPPVRYRDVARWQSGRPVAAESVEFWRRTLAGVPPLDLPLDRPRPRRPSFAGGSVPVDLPAELVARLAAAGRAEGATPFTVLLAGMAATLSRWSGQPDLAVAVATGGRTTPATQDVVGFLATTVLVRIDLSGRPTFRELLGRTRRASLAAYAHQDVPLTEMLRGLPGASGAGHDLLRAAVLVQDGPPPAWRTSGVRAELVELPVPSAPFDLSLHLSATADGGLSGRLAFATDLFDAATAGRIADTLGRMLTLGPASLDRPLWMVQLLDRSERDRLRTELGGVGRRPARFPAVTAAVEHWAAVAPDRVALECGRARLTYRELEARANQLARVLRAAGVGPEQPVAVRLPRSPDLVVAMLAVLKAGGVYVPVDPALPAQRTRFLLDDVHASVAVTRADLPLPAGEAVRQVRLDADADRIAAEPTEPLPPSTRPDNLAYVVYTSGSTGTPKGAANTHAGLVNLLAARRTAWPLGPDDGVLLHTALGFDVSVSEILWPLTAGSRLVCPPPAQDDDPARLVPVVVGHRVTHAYFVPSVLRAVLAAPDAGSATCLRMLHTIGEELTPALVAETRRLLPGTRLVNVYGPAEATVEVTAADAPEPPIPSGRVPVGRPLPGARVHVLDGDLQAVPVGMPGEIHIGGVPLARGYWRRPGLTADRFRPDPCEPGGRLYRTGDRGRWGCDGSLEFLGRVDRQVKIRGHRIEPGELEAVLLGHPSVAAAAAEVRLRGGEPALVGYVVGAAGAPAVSELMAYLRAELPSYLVPGAIVVLPELPLNSSGKLDRRVLPDPSDLAGEQPPYEPPRTAVEELVAGIWREVLGVDRVGRQDEFFRLGGHSLMASRVVSRLRATFGVEVGVADVLLGHSTVARLAGAVERRQLDAASEDEVRAALARLDTLSEDEVRARLDRATTRD